MKDAPSSERASEPSAQYVPRITHTDDYPELSIALIGSGVELFSTSQGTGHVPWGLRVDGTMLVVPSDHPAQALDALRPYLVAGAGGTAAAAVGP